MVKRVLRLMYSEIRGLHQAAYILALFAIGSQMLGLIRDRLLAHTFGASGELDLYYAAFRIPDLLFALFSSVLSIYVLLPFVSKARAEKNHTGGVDILSQMFTVFVLLYSLVALTLFIITPYLVPRLFPGFVDQSPLITLLIRILLLQPFLLGLSSLYGVVTQFAQRFILYAISPLLYNLGIIVGVTFLYPWLGLPGLVVGVVFGAAAHLLVQLPLVRSTDLAFGFVRQINWSIIRSVLTFAFPRALTLSIYQAVLLVLFSLATMMSTGSISIFQFAYNLQSVPLAIIGMSYSVAAFPVLAELFAKQEREAFCQHVMTAFRHIIFWSLPIIALVIVLRAQVVRVVLGSGEFSWNDTRLTAALLAIFVISLVAQSMKLLLVRAFYAGGNTKAPLLIALFSAFVTISGALLLQLVYHKNISFQLWLVDILRLDNVAGTEVLVLAFGFIIGIIFEMILLLIFSGRYFGISWRPLRKQTVEALCAAVVAGISAYVTLIFIVDGINQGTFIGILIQGIIACIVGVVGAILTYYVFDSQELKEITHSFKSKLLKTNVIGPQSPNL